MKSSLFKFVKIVTIICIMTCVVLCSNAALATDWLQDYASKGTNVVTIAADLLYEYGPFYVGQTVVTAINVKEKESDCLKADTDNNDTYSFSVVADFPSKSELSTVIEGQTVIVIGTVDEFNTISLFGSDKTVNLKGCHIVTDEVTLQDIETTKDQQVQAAKANVEEQEALAAQAASDAQQTYISSCEAVDYHDVERNPNQYKGRKIYVTGSVIQVSEGWFDSVTMRVDEGSSNIWYVTYSRKDDNEARILEGDKLTFYGECDGVETYTSILGGSVTIPALKAEIISGDAVKINQISIAPVQQKASMQNFVGL